MNSFRLGQMWPIIWELMVTVAPSLHSSWAKEQDGKDKEEVVNCTANTMPRESTMRVVVWRPEEGV